VLERNTGRMAPYLFNPDAADRERMIRELVNRQLQDRRRHGILAPAVRGLLQGAAVTGGLLTQ
jgi:hypothetical protein